MSRTTKAIERSRVLAPSFSPVQWRKPIESGCHWIVLASNCSCAKDLAAPALKRVAYKWVGYSGIHRHTQRRRRQFFSTADHLFAPSHLSRPKPVVSLLFFPAFKKVHSGSQSVDGRGCIREKSVSRTMKRNWLLGGGL